MQKTGKKIVASGLFILAGLVMVAVTSTVVLMDISQGNGIVSTAEPLVIEAEIDADDASGGVFAVQVPGFEGGTLAASVQDPSGMDVASLEIVSENTESVFDAAYDGTYTLIITGDSENMQVFGAIGPAPGEWVALYDVIPTYLIVVGFIAMGAIILKSLMDRRGSRQAG